MRACIQTSIILILSLLCITCFCQSAKTGISRYFNEDVLPGIDPEDFVKLEFDWNFAGNIQAKMNAALTDLDEKNYASATENFREVLKLLPDLFPAHYYLGVSLKAEGKFREAESAFRQTILLSRRCWQAHLQLAETLQLQWMYTDSEKAYLHASSLNPTTPEPYFNLGHLEMAKGNDRKAFKLYVKSTEVQKNFAKGYVMQGLVKMPKAIHDTEALTYFNLALQADSLCKEALFWRGLYFIFKNQGLPAIKDWNLLVQTNPGNMRFAVFRGFLNIDLERYDEAFADLRKAVEARVTDEYQFTGEKTLLDKQIDVKLATRYIIRNTYGLKTSAQIHFKKGYCLFLIGKYDDAIAAFHSALRVETAPVIYFGKAIAYEHAGNHGQALINYSEALSLDPEIFEALKKRALYRAEKLDWKGANEDLIAMEKLEPGSVVIAKLRGYTKIRFKNYYGGIVDLTEFIKYDSSDSDVFFNRGFCHDKVGNYRLAADDYLQALRYDSTKSALYSVTSDQLLKARDTLTALEISKLRTKKFPGDAAAWVELGNVQMLRGMNAEGHVSIDKALAKITPMYFDKSELFVRASHIKGMIYLREKNYKASIKQFSKVLEFSSKDPESQYQRAKCHVILRDFRSAQKDFLSLAGKNYRDSKEILASLPKK